VSNKQEEEEEKSSTLSAATIITKPAKTDHPINELIAKRWYGNHTTNSQKTYTA
jgi:hypothetical protein